MASLPSLDEILAAVDSWFAEEVQRSPVSYHTECYNQMYAARASLRDRLAVVVTGSPLPVITPPAEEPNEADAGAEGSEEPEGTTSEPSGSSKPSKPSKSGD